MTFLRRLLARLWQWLHPASSPGLDPEENAVVRALLAPELDPEVNTETPSLPTPGALLLECRWDPSNQQDCQDALSLFNSLRTHKSIYRLTETGQRAEYLQAFDSTLGRMGVFAQRTQWDHIREAANE
jgi:hypothetical protein